MQSGKWELDQLSLAWQLTVRRSEELLVLVFNIVSWTLVCEVRNRQLGKEIGVLAGSCCRPQTLFAVEQADEQQMFLQRFAHLRKVVCELLSIHIVLRASLHLSKTLNKNNRFLTL